jgi:predicted nucleic acid-binding protein
VKVYLDTGPFIDYLSQRGIASLRTASRGGRALTQIHADIDRLMHRIRARHDGYMSTLTFYEIEEAYFKSLSANTRGVSNAATLVIPIARSATVQALTAARLFGITARALTPSVVEEQLRAVELQIAGIRSADALHLASALEAGVDIFVSTDSKLIALDGMLENSSGIKLVICDSDIALAKL